MTINSLTSSICNKYCTLRVINYSQSRGGGPPGRHQTAGSTPSSLSTLRPKKLPPSMWIFFNVNNLPFGVHSLLNKYIWTKQTRYRSSTMMTLCHSSSERERAIFLLLIFTFYLYFTDQRDIFALRTEMNLIPANFGKITKCGNILTNNHIIQILNKGHQHGLNINRILNGNIVEKNPQSG